MKILSFKSLTIAFVLLLGIMSSLAAPGSCSDLCEQCGTPGSLCDTDPVYLGDAQLCYTNAPECGGIPVNENSYLLIIVGIVLVFILLTANRYKKINFLTPVFRWFKAEKKHQLLT